MGSIMQRFIPRAWEVFCLFIFAFVAATIVWHAEPASADLTFAAVVVPTFLLASVLGLRHSPGWQRASIDADLEPDEE